MAAQAKHTAGPPWDDCKIAFGLDWSDELDALTDEWCERPRDGFPPGWEFDGVDFSGAQAVALFRVEGFPTAEAASTIRAAIAKAEGRP